MSASAPSNKKRKNASEHGFNSLWRHPDSPRIVARTHDKSAQTEVDSQLLSEVADLLSIDDDLDNATRDEPQAELHATRTVIETKLVCIRGSTLDARAIQILDGSGKCVNEEMMAAVGNESPNEHATLLTQYQLQTAGVVSSYRHLIGLRHCHTLDPLYGNHWGPSDRSDRTRLDRRNSPARQICSDIHGW
ncbi:hypothetical protein HBH53_192830 [Parastagonospora nodorum]|nr:hypothetical protein HBH53_192830 [Parastagonospora nodorum]KAH3992584.1 hypothetical protein HBI10_214120 [Parastagonospora nodorum]KAH4115446.1 hypothetical protein HBH47_180770 [Parastagonospora nodorum]KAH4183025.1 hypothetical protein HBH42_208770 [Parastagonospora nodorum]KAH4322088.1 hypothetical protein HBI00_201390 [Parastagonospora nodorum]